MLRSASLAALSLLAVLVAACGGGSGSGDVDPATAVPRGAIFYLEVSVRPEGEVRESALDAAGKVLRTADPEAKIRELVDKAFAEGDDTDVSYERDVEPWLGERAGLWVSDRLDDNGDPGVVGIVATTDADKAQSAIEEGRKRNGEPPTTKRSHAGVDYQVDEDGFAYAVTDDFVLFGDEPELEQTIDATKGDSLADEDRYRDAIAGLDDNRLAHFFLDLKRVIDLGVRGEPGAAEQLRQLESLFPLSQLPPLGGAFLADGDRLAIDLVMHAASEDVLDRLGALGGGAGRSPLLGELPGDSWAALAAPKMGENLRRTFDQLAGAVGGSVVTEQLRREYGVDLERDVFSWMGDTAVFVRGDSVNELDGGLVIGVTDEDRARDAFGKLVGALQKAGGVRARPIRVPGAESAFAIRQPSMPAPIVFARGGDKVVLTYGEDAAVQALDPATKLADSDVYREAADALGNEVDPSILVSVPVIDSLVQSAGAADADWEQLRPYLETLTVFAIGGKREGSSALSRIAAGLK
jgi:hypothetical protein